MKDIHIDNVLPLNVINRNGRLYTKESFSPIQDHLIKNRMLVTLDYNRPYDPFKPDIIIDLDRVIGVVDYFEINDDCIIAHWKEINTRMNETYNILVEKMGKENLVVRPAMICGNTTITEDGVKLYTDVQIKSFAVIAKSMDSYNFEDIPNDIQK